MALLITHLETAVVIKVALSDDSTVYNVTYYDDIGEPAITLGARDEDHAKEMAEMINTASYVETY